MMDMAREQSEFWSKVAGKYDVVVEQQLGTNTRAMARDRLSREERLGAVAEFGCGTGYNTEILAARADTVVATDLAPGMLALAKRNVTSQNVTFKQENCQQTSFPDASFDTVFLGLVLHFTEPPKALAEMHRILKPGGLLIVLNPDPFPLSGFARFRWLVRGYFYGITRYRTKPPKDFLKHVMTEAQLCDYLVKAGFEILSVETIRNSQRASNLPIEFIKAIRLG
jgi:ubiquinone/menaquinone biosynthesis C-methylase UbiE